MYLIPLNLFVPVVSKNKVNKSLKLRIAFEEEQLKESYTGGE
jgi:hypothetical protein